MLNGAITLADVAAKTDTLVVACRRCDKSERYPMATLLRRHGRWFSVPGLLRLLSADCPQRQTARRHELCGLHCPGLAALLGVGSQPGGNTPSDD
jgi:hypothetical protein